MLVGTNLKEVKYVAVEVIRNNAVKAADIECGLFMGICCKKDTTNRVHKFLALLTNKTSVRLYNMSEYKIVTVDTVAETTRYMTIFTHEALEQVEATTLLGELTVVLNKEEKLYKNDPNKELIDVDKYTDYPKAILEFDNITQERANPSIAEKAGAYHAGNHYPPANSTSQTTSSYVAVDKKPEVTVIKRKGRLPSTETLLKMKECVKLIASGQFVVKALPIPECDRLTQKGKDFTMVVH